MQVKLEASQLFKGKKHSYPQSVRIPFRDSALSTNPPNKLETFIVRSYLRFRAEATNACYREDGSFAVGRRSSRGKSASQCIIALYRSFGLVFLSVYQVRSTRV